jgi:hypothetical protein
MSIDQAVVLATFIGTFMGLLFGTAHGINSEKKRNRLQRERLINTAMAAAYQAGYTDGKHHKQNLARGL